MSKKDFGLGFLLGLLVRMWRTLGWAALFVVMLPFVVWAALPEWVQWLVGLAALAGAVLWVAWRTGRIKGDWTRHLLPSRAARRPRAGWLPRTTLEPFYVYVISEYRDRNDLLLTLAEGRKRGIRHLVYVGKANDPKPRFQRHAADKPWWHDELEFVLIRCRSPKHALHVERQLIVTRAYRKALNERPRENKAMNPTYDAQRSEDMRRRALVAVAP